MNKLLKIIVSLIQIGGGLVGIGLIGCSLLTDQLPTSTAIIHIAFIFVFLFGILAGLALLKKPKLGLSLSAVFQAMQIPIFKGSMAAYSMSSGACFNIYWHEAGFGFNFSFGSRYHFSIGNGNPWLIGVNILALILFILLVREIWKEVTSVKTREFESSFERQAQQFMRGQDQQTHGSPLRNALH